MSPLSPFAARRGLCLIAAILDLIAFGHGAHTVPFSLCDSSHCCSLHELKSCSLGETASPWCTMHRDSTHHVDYIFHCVPTSVAYAIQTTVFLNWIPSAFIWTSSSFKMDLVKFLALSFFFIFLIPFPLVVNVGFVGIWISRVAVGKRGFWCFLTFFLSSKKL